MDEVESTRSSFLIILSILAIMEYAPCKSHPPLVICRGSASSIHLPSQSLFTSVILLPDSLKRLSSQPPCRAASFALEKATSLYPHLPMRPQENNAALH